MLPEQQFFITTWPKTAFFVSQLASGVRQLEGVVNVFGGMAKNFAHVWFSTSLSYILDMPLTIVTTLKECYTLAHLVKLRYVNNVSYAVFVTSTNLNQFQMMVIDPTGKWCHIKDYTRLGLGLKVSKSPFTVPVNPIPLWVFNRAMGGLLDTNCGQNTV